jgi:hypothetical protein
MDNLMNEIEVVHAMNLTALFQDMKTFDKDVLEEKTKLVDVQASLDKIKTIKELQEFDLLKVNIQAIHQPAEQAKLFIWGGIGLSTVVIIVLMWWCCPAFCANILGIIFKMLTGALRCLFGGLFDCIGKSLPSMQTVRSIFTRERPVSNEDTVSYSEDNIQLRRRRNIYNEPKSILTNRPQSTVDPDGSIFAPPREQEMQERQTLPRAASYQSLRKALLPEFEQAQLTVNTSDGNRVQPSAPSSPNLATPDFDWMILQKAEDRLLLQTCKNERLFTFVPETSQVYTHTGNHNREHTPPAELVSEYLNRWYKLPEIKPDDIQKKHPDWKFNRQMASFFEERYGLILFHYGYRVKFNR